MQCALTQQTDTAKKALRETAKRNRDRAHAQFGSCFQELAACAQRIPSLTDAVEPVVSGYIAIGSELDPAPLLAALEEFGNRIALPVIKTQAAPLEFRAWRIGDALVSRMWGIKEPGPECLVCEPDILLVPLLLVDRVGNRLGYGGGFYDRTISRLRSAKPIVAIGVAYDEQWVDAVPHEAYDEPLDYILTPGGLHKF